MAVVIISALVLLMLLQVIVFRIHGVYQSKVDEKAKKIWRPVLAELMLSYPDSVPSLDRKHRDIFLREWNQLYSILRGDARLRLQILSRQKNLEVIAHRYINSRDIAKLLRGIVTLGHMQDLSIWDRLIDLVHSENPVLSMTAAQALVDIDSKNAVSFLLPHIIKRRDWPAARVAIMLNSASPGQLSILLEQAIKNAPSEDVPYILGFLASSHFDPEISKLCKRLGNSQDSRIIAACIDAAKDADGLELARQHADSPLWYIRLHVARAIGRLGTRTDVPILIKLMSDSEWWVRYRSAQALSQLPFINTDELEKLHQQLDDRYAREILQQAITEQQWV